MKIISTSAVLGATAVAALLTFGTMSSAQGPNKCLAGKNKCVSKKNSCLLGVEAKARKKGLPPDVLKLQKCKDKYDGGIAPAKGCFAKLELTNDGPCVTSSDFAAFEAKVDAFVDDVVDELDPNPANDLNECTAGKIKCVSKKAKCILNVHRKAVTTGLPPDAAKLQKCKDKFDGGVEPAKGCFAKLQAKPGCLTVNDVTALENKVDAFVTDVLCELGYTTLACGPPATPTTTTTPTPTVTPTCPPPPVFQGSLTSTLGRFNYNAMIGLPAANAACNSNFPGSHPCTYFELQCAQAAGSLVGATDTSANLVTSFWAINHSAPPLTQCQDDVGSFLNWEYGTAHTGSRGQRVTLNNPAGTLGPLQGGQGCFFGGTPNWVGCCQ